MQLKHIDMNLVEYLAEQPGNRQTRQNIAYDLYNKVHEDTINLDNMTGDDKHAISNFSNRLWNRLNDILLDNKLAVKIGPAPNSGLYQLTSKGVDVAEIMGQNNIDTNTGRLYARANLASAGYDVE